MDPLRAYASDGFDHDSGPSNPGNAGSARCSGSSRIGARASPRREMFELGVLERSPVYLAVGAVLVAVQRTALRWPERLADRAMLAALDAAQLTAEAVGAARSTSSARTSVGDAIACMVAVASCVDLARVMRFGGDDSDEVQQLAARAITMLGMALQVDAPVVRTRAPALPAPSAPPVSRRTPLLVRAVGDDTRPLKRHLRGAEMKTPEGVA